MTGVDTAVAESVRGAVGRYGVLVGKGGSRACGSATVLGVVGNGVPCACVSMGKAGMRKVGDVGASAGEAATLDGADVGGAMPGCPGWTAMRN